MNGTDVGGTVDKIGRFSYGIGISIGLLIILTAIMLLSYYCARQGAVPLAGQLIQQQAEDPARFDQEAGVDEATLMSLPKVLYSDAGKSTASCCSICLADYKGSDVLRRLPDCDHLFHLKCVDPWLRRHPTCPVCRTSPLPSPLSTPLAEVAPLRLQS